MYLRTISILVVVENNLSVYEAQPMFKGFHTIYFHSKDVRRYKICSNVFHAVKNK